MAKKTIAGKLSDESVLRIARSRVTESAAGVYTQGEIDTQLSVERGVIWMIHFAEFRFADLKGLAIIAADSTESYKAQITRETKSAIVAGNDSDLIQAHQLHTARSTAIGAEVGPLWFMTDLTRRFDYPIAIPYASQSVFVAIETTAPSVQLVDVRIGYTIKEVDDQFFFRVAQALLG